MPNSPSKIIVFGAGGVGAYYAALLARSGAPVFLVARGETKSAIARSGIEVRDFNEHFSTTINLVEDLGLFTDPVFVLLCTKTYHLNSIVEDLRKLPPGSVVMTLQNGIESDLKIIAECPQLIVLPGTIWLLGTMIAPGVVEQKLPRERTAIKFGTRFNNPLPNEAKQFALQLNQFGVLAETSTCMEQIQWDKFGWLTCFSGLCGLSRTAIGPILKSKEGILLWIKAMEEVLELANAVGVKLPKSYRTDTINRLNNHKTPDAKPSLLVDLERGRPTEIDYLSGAVVKLGRQHSVSTPIHETIWTAISLGSGS